MSEYKVQLEVFEGPLDLLLYLIKKNEVDIYNIPIATITSQYMEYLDLMKLVVPDVAGEFIVMGATLMYIKSRTLLPVDQQVVDPEAQSEDADPRWELIRQLVEYKKFKDAAEHLGERETFQQSVYARQQALLGFDTPPEDAPMEAGQVSIFDLLNAFSTVLKRADQVENLREIFEDRFTVSDKIDFILKLTNLERRTRFSSLFDGMATRTEIVVTFLALLELIRLRKLRVAQSEAFGEIDIVRADEESPAATLAATPAEISSTPEDPAPASTTLAEGA
jgi:segregation and condensation protein A